MSVELHLNNQPKELSSVGKKERETEHLVKKLWRGTLDSQRAVSGASQDRWKRCWAIQWFSVLWELGACSQTEMAVIVEIFEV